MIKSILALVGCISSFMSIGVVLPAMGATNYVIFGIILGEAAILVAAYRAADDPLARLSLSTAIVCVAIGIAIGLFWPAAIVLGAIWLSVRGRGGAGRRIA